MNLVFGTCVHANPAGPSTFFRVEGCIDDRGNFMPLNHTAARYQFPNRGAIRALHLTTHGRYGTFKVVEDPQFERHASDPNGARFKAIPTASALYQTILVPEESTGVDLVANRLRSGIKLAGEVVSRTPIFIFFSDNVLCG